MKLLVTSDIHSNPNISRKLRRLINNEDFDLIINCGDVGGKVFYAKDIEEFSELQQKDYLEFKEDFPEIYYILGNDDWFEAINDEKHIPQANLPNIVGFELVPFTPFGTNREASETKIAYELLKMNIEKEIGRAHV